MSELLKTDEKSGMFKLNLRDMLRGLAVAAMFGAFTIITSVDEVQDFANTQLWLDVANGMWKAISSYLVLNLLSRK